MKYFASLHIQFRAASKEMIKFERTLASANLHCFALLRTSCNFVNSLRGFLLVLNQSSIHPIRPIVEVEILKGGSG